jgi:hypothetical protein
MYEFLDRPVTSLDPGGRFLIWAMRSWVKSMDDKRCPATTVGTAFAKWDMLTGLQPFLRMMALFNRHGLETFQFCPLRCNHVSEHEALILSLVIAHRDSQPETVRNTLALLAEEEAIGQLITAFSELGRSMAKALIFPGLPSRNPVARDLPHDDRRR